MSNQVLTRSSICEVLCRSVGLSRTQSLNVLESTLEEVISALEKGQDVKISSFGTFKILHKGARVGRNPKTGTEVTIAPRKSLSFKPSHILKSTVNK